MLTLTTDEKQAALAEQAAIEEKYVAAAYNLTEPPSGKWSGQVSIPEIGTRVYCKINKLGYGLVEHYFTEHGYIGVQVRLENDPDWHVKQTKNDWHAGLALVFGAEIQ